MLFIQPCRFEKKVLMLRRPKDHLLSIYQQCHQPGPMEIKAMERRGIAPGQPGFTLPSFGDWVRSWNQHPPKKFYHAHDAWPDLRKVGEERHDTLDSLDTQYTHGYMGSFRNHPRTQSLASCPETWRCCPAEFHHFVPPQQTFGFSTPLELRCFRRRLRSRDGPKAEARPVHHLRTVDPPSQGYHNERFHCMDPRNPAGWQLTCTDLGARPVHIDEKKSLAILYSASVVGILEAYHESICLFSAKLRRRCFKKESRKCRS